MTMEMETFLGVKGDTDRVDKEEDRMTVGEYGTTSLTPSW
jgi:hypothetical protein